MEPRRATVGVYVPPGKRNGGRLSAPNARQNTPQKEQSTRQMMPNCCEDDVNNSGLDDSQNAESSPNDQGQSNRQGNRIVDKKRLHSDEFPIIERKIQGKPHVAKEKKAVEKEEPDTRNDWRIRPADAYVRSEPMSMEKFQGNDVAYIDSHCHTDFIYTYFHRNRSGTHEGLCKWIEQCSAGFPRSFAGLIANFIQPSLFVRTEATSRDYDMEWILDELKSTSLYLGTTWGCHPHHAKNWGNSEDFWQTLEHILSEKHRFRVIAVGECGVDLHRCETLAETQKMVFERHVELAYKYDLPLVIHCRNGAKGNAEAPCLDIVSKVMAKNHPYLRIHRHCFTEDWETAKKWLERFPDVHFGFTAGIFQFNAGQLEAVRKLPLDRILLETDAPYFKPRMFEGVGPSKACLPGMAIATAYRIAEIKGVAPEEVLRATYNNTRRLYKLAVF